MSKLVYIDHLGEHEFKEDKFYPLPEGVTSFRDDLTTLTGITEYRYGTIDHRHKCEYCGTMQLANRCESCGAPRTK